MDLNNFGPFQADVWGTFSDWIMIIVTGITAYYLYRTLQSQKEVSILQKKITDIESYKHRMGILPRFKVDFIRKDIMNSSNTVSGMFSARFTNNENMALNTVFKIIVEEDVDFRPLFANPYLNPRIQPSERILLTSKFSAFTHSSATHLNMFWYPLNLEIQYNDVDKNHYKQAISCVFSDKNEDDWIIYKEPELIS
jgi:hypothetical protein